MTRRMRGIGVDGRFLTREQEASWAPRIGAARMVLTMVGVSVRAGVGGRRGRRRRRARERAETAARPPLSLAARTTWIGPTATEIADAAWREGLARLHASTTPQRLGLRIRAAVDARADEIAALE